MAVIDDFFGKNAVKTNKVKRKAPSAAAETAVKKAKVKVKTEEKTGGSGAVSAEDVLKTIPDADPALLELSEDAEKMNFFQLKAKQNANKGEAAVVDIDSIPTGRANCLNGLTIVFTGVLPSLDREQCEQLAARYGAKVTKSISGKTSLVVIGNDAGPSKVKKIKALGTKCIDESGFIGLISSMPADGGSGEAAVRELAKKRELERQVEEEIEEEVKKEKQQAAAVAKQQQKTAGKASSSPVVERKPVDKDTQLWTDRYAPTDMKHICGNKGNVELLHEWLSTWFEKKHDLNGAGIEHYRAVLISGPPGIGKTTAATLISKKLGYDVIEKNASDFRSKKILNEQLKVCLDNTSVSGYFHHNGEPVGESANGKRFVLLMDEVDGMSSGDNGGVAQLAQFCRTTKTPMILICNDKSLPKMRTLDKYCFDLVWRRPTAREMKSRLMSIAHREGLKLDPNLVEKLVAITHNDIRQIINIMSTVARTQRSLSFDNLHEMQDSWEKEVSLKPFDVIAKLLSPNRLSVNDRIALYFNDMDIVPLMVHENYRSTRPAAAGAAATSKLAHLRRLARASDLISQSDLVNQRIRSGQQQWSLLPLHAILSTVYPALEVQGQITGRINFTGWLGQNSRKMKYDRVVQTLQYHTCTRTGTNNVDLRLDYVPYLRGQLLAPLVSDGAEGIPRVLALLDTYYLTREDLDSVLELAVHGSMKHDDVYKRLPAAVKSALTRKYNSYVHPTLIYKTGDSVGASVRRDRDASIADEEERELEDKGDNAAGDGSGSDDDSSSDAGDALSLGRDSLIRAVKPRAGRPGKTTASRPRARGSAARPKAAAGAGARSAR